MRILVFAQYLALSCGLIFSAGAWAKSKKAPSPEADQRVAAVKACAQDWRGYKAALDGFRQAFREKLKTVSDDEFSKMEEALDPSLVLLSSLWPEDLKEKDELWTTYQECSGLHQKILADLDDKKLTPERKLHMIENFRECARDRYLRNKKLAPLEELTACYEKQAKK
ncbi:MAG: hypothetical protein AB7F86_20205 [Bdellovibrionales bacterium]